MEGPATVSPYGGALVRRVRETMSGDASGHDFAHVLRVRHLALQIAGEEGAEPETVELIALLHDVESHTGREGHGARGAETAAAWLARTGAGAALIEQVAAAIATLSWGGGKTPASLEGRVVQDADRLDAIGAVGIARAFAYGGAHGRSPGLRAPDLGRPGPGNTVEHFHEKLLKLKATLHTATARRLGAGRHAFLMEFLRRVEEESEGRG